MSQLCSEGGSLSDDKRSISFAASGVQETAQGGCFWLRCPLREQVDPSVHKGE